MNTIYKIQWNGVRQQYVVTNETSRSHRKGRWRSSVIATAVAGALVSSAAANGLTATTITAQPGWQHTSISGTNGKYDIKTDRVVHGIGENRFDRFELKAGNIANLHHGTGSTKLVNFVNQQIKIDGTVNGIVGSQVGGELFFVSPMGMTIGKSGVINTGSLTAIAPELMTYGQYLLTGGADLTDAQLAKWRAGEVPINRNATISVKGSINAGNDVSLVAARIDVAEGARITTRATDFSDLVNIKDGNGTVVLSSGIANGELTGKVDAAGDVVLFAVGDTTRWEQDETGTPTGAAVFYENTAAAIRVDGVLDARKDATVKALAGNGAWDGKQFVAGGTNLHTIVNASVDVTGSITADNAVTVNATALNHLDNSAAKGFVGSVDMVTTWFLNNKLSITFDAAYGNLTTNAAVTVAKDASLTAQKGPLSLTAKADTSLTIGASPATVTSFPQTHPETQVTQYIPTATAAVGLVDNDASVTVEGELTTGSHLTVGADAALKADVWAEVGTVNHAGPEASLVVANLYSNATTDVKESAVLTVSDAGQSVVDIHAVNTNSVATSASASIQDESYAGVVMNYTEMRTDATVTMDTGIVNEAAGIAINATNTTQSLTVKADAGIGPFAFVKRINQTIGTIPLDFIAGMMGNAAYGIDPNMTEANFRLGGSVGVFSAQQTASVRVDAPKNGTLAGLRSKGDVTIKSSATIRDHQFYANARVVTSPNDQSKGQASLALFVATAGDGVDKADDTPTLSSTVNVEDGTAVETSSGNILITSEALVTWTRVQTMQNQLKGLVKMLEGLWTDLPVTEKNDMAVAQAWQAVQDAAAQCEAAFNGIGSTETFLGGMTDFNRAMQGVSSTVTTFLGLVSPFVDTAGLALKIPLAAMAFTSPTNYVNTYVASGGRPAGGAFAAAGAIAVVNQWAKSEVHIGKTVELTARGTDTPETTSDGKTIPAILRGRVNVVGRTENDGTMLVGHLENLAGFSLPNIHSGSAAGAALGLQTLETDNVVRIDEGARLTADNAVTVDADDTVSSILIGGSSDITKGKLGLDILGAVSVTNGSNRIELDDEVWLSARDIRIDAQREDDLQTVAGTVLVSHGDSATASVGASIALNIGSMQNQVVVKDTDGDTNVTSAPGVWDAEGTLAVTADADTAMNAVSVAGSAMLDADDGTPGALDGLKAWTHGHVLVPVATKFVGLNRSLNQLEQSLVDKAYDTGTRLHEKITHNQTQNAADSAVAGAVARDENGHNRNPGQVDLSGQGAGGATTAGTNTTHAATDPAAATLKINLAGTFALNATDIVNTIDVDVDAMTIDASDVAIEAVADKWIGTWAGTAAVTYMGSLTQSDWAAEMSVGVAGAVGLNVAESTSSVSIKGDGTTKGLVIGNGVSDGDPTQTSATDVRIYAVNDGTILTEGLAASASQSGGVSVGADISVAGNAGATVTRTTVEGLRLVGATDATHNHYDQAAWVGDTQVTGGTGMGVATGTLTGTSSSQLGFVVAVADLDNTVESVLKRSEIDANRVDVRALASLVQVTTAISAQVAGTKSTLAFSGTAGTAALRNTVHAQVHDASVNLTGQNGLVQVVARDATDDEHAVLDAVTEAQFAFDTVAYEYVDAAGVTQTSDGKSNNAFYEDVALYTDAQKSASQTLNVEDFLSGSNMVQSSVVISLGVAGSGQSTSASAGAGVLVNQIRNDFTTTTRDVSVTQATPTASGAYLQTAESNVVSVGVALGAAGSGGKFSAAGSVLVSDIEQTTETSADTLTLQTHTTQLTAGNKAVSANVAGNVGVSVGQSSAALGAAVAVTNTYNTADVAITNVSMDNDAGIAGRFEAAARNEAIAVGAAVDAGVSASVAVGGSVLVNRALNDTTVAIEGLTLDEVSSTRLTATDDTLTVSLGGNVAVAGQAGVSGAVVYAASGDDTTGTRVAVTDLTVSNESNDEATRNDVDVSARATDQVLTFATSVGVATQTAGVAGVATTNEICREVQAQAGDISSEGSALKSLEIEARQDVDIDNGAVVAAAGATAGVGVGVSVNRIDNRTDARLYDKRHTPSVVATDLLHVSAVTDNDIDTVAVGGSGAGTASVSGSVGVNLIESDTTATIDGTRASFAAGVIEARSDDTIGNYGGQASGSGTAAEGLTVTVSEKKGTTSVTLDAAELTETGGTASLSTQVGVKDDSVADGFVQDLNSVVSLKNKRENAAVEGLGVFATSTENFKTFLINGTGSGVQSAVGTNNVTYHGGATALTVADSTLATVDGLETLSGDYVAVDTSMNSATGSQVAVAETVNVTTTEHTTSAVFSDSTITGDVRHRAEAKEGLSHLILGVAGSFYASVSPVVNVNRFLSDVTTTVERTTVDAGSYDQQTTYLGYANGGSGLGNGAAFAAAGVNVNVNYFGNDVKNIVSDSAVDADAALTLAADRTVDVQMVDVTLTGAIGAIGTYVNVNTIEGETLTQVTRGATLTGTGDARIGARNLDRLHLVGVNGAGGVGSGGATVVVNDVYGKATVEVGNSTIDMNAVDLRAAQDRDLSAVAAFGGVAGVAVEANVIVNNVGSNDDAFATSETGLQKTEALVEQYRADYASASVSGDEGVLSTLESTADTYLSADEKTSLMQSAATDASQAHQATGTIASVHSSVVKAKAGLSVKAEEDMGSEAEIKVEAGMGTAGVASVAASVATLRYNHAAAVALSSSVLSAEDTTLGAYWGGQKHVAAYQGTLALATAVAAYADVKLVGGATVRLNDTSVASDNHTTIEYRDTSVVSADAFGITIGGVAGGGTVGHLEDRTASSVVVTGGVGSALTGDTTIVSVRDAERLSDVTAGYGALVVGIGALSKVYDHGAQSIEITGATVTGNALTVTANNQMTLSTSAKGDGASLVGVGVVEAYTHARGDTAVTLQNNVLTVDNVRLTASSGRETDDADDALTVKGYGEAYSGTVVADINVNAVELVNSTTTALRVNDNAFVKGATSQSEPVLDMLATGYAVYDAQSCVGGGGLAYSGNTLVGVEHAADVTADFDAGTSGVRLDRLTVQALNKEAVQARASSYGGGAVVVELSSDKVNSAEIRHEDTSDVRVKAAGTVETVGDIDLKSTSVHDLAVDVDNTKGAIGGGSGAALQNTMTGTAGVAVADDAVLTAGDSLYLDARTDLKLTGLRDADGRVKDPVVVKSAVYGAVTGTGISVNNDVNRTASVSIGQRARLTAQNRLQASAYTDASVDWRVRANSAGAIEGVDAVSDHVIVTTNVVTVEQDARLVNRNVDEDLVLSAAGHETYYLEAIGDVQGAVVAGAGGNSTLAYTRNNAIDIEVGAQLIGAGDVQLASGRDADGLDGVLDVTVLSHAYSHSFIAGVDADINDTFKTNDTITVAGDVLATRSIQAYADQGNVSTLEEARRWTIWSHKDWGDTEMASTAMGVQSRNMQENSVLTVTGSMKAGTQTTFDLTIDGVVDPDPNDAYELSGSQAEPTLTFSSDTNVQGTYKVEETSVANYYWARHEYLLEQMALYVPGDAQSEGIYYALKAEDDYLLQRMEAEGYAKKQADGTYTMIQTEKKHAVFTVSDIVVSGGTIDITSGAVQGDGTIAARYADGIEIENRSSMMLSVNNLVVLDDGGVVRYNDVNVGSIDGFGGTLESAMSSEAPVLTVTSKYAGGAIDVTSSEAGQTGTQSYVPDDSILLGGTIANRAGNVTVNSAHDIRSTAEISAAGQLSLTASSGAIVQGYQEGITNIGANPQDIWQDKVIEAMGKSDGSSIYDTSVRAGGGTFIAGGDVVITGDIVNVNGLIQSGYAWYGIELTDAETADRIDAITQAWKKAGSSTNINPRTSEFVLSEGGYDLVDGQYVYRTTAWYDPVHQRVILDDIEPKGGHVYLTGRIANTGGGRIVVADGHATVNVSVGQYDLQTGHISTGNVRGFVSITDTSWNQPTNNYMYPYRLTEYTPSDTSDEWIVRSEVWDPTRNQWVHAGQPVKNTYNPWTGMVYTWSEGQGEQVVQTTTTTQDFKWWGGSESREEVQTVTNTTKHQLDALDAAESVLAMNTFGGPLWDGMQANDAAFQSHYLIKTSDTSTTTKTWTTYKNFLHFKGTHHSETVTTTSQQKEYQFGVRADHAVKVNRIGGDNSISIASGKSVYLGGNLEAQGGKIAVKAGDDIVQMSSGNAIRGAAEVSLTATNGSIGTDAKAVQLAGAKTMSLTAAAGKHAYLDADQLTADSVLTATLEVGKTVRVETANDLKVLNVTGTDIAFDAKGSIDVDVIKQNTHADGMQRLDARAEGDITVADGNTLWIGQIVAGGDVSLSAYALASSRAIGNQEQMSADEKIQHWIDIGILGQNGETKQERYASDKAQIEGEMRAAWSRMQAYEQLGDQRNASQQAQYDALQQRFAGFDTVDAYIADQAAQSGTLLNLVETNKDNYHAWNKTELLYAVAESVINPDASTGSSATVPNVRANGTIRLTAKGLIGEHEPAKQFDLTERFVADDGSLTDNAKAFYETISRAQAQDVLWNRNDRTITVTLKNPLTVDFVQDVDTQYVTADGASVFLQTLADKALRFDAIKAVGATGEVRLTTGTGIVGLGTDNLIQAHDITLHGGKGTIGMAAQAVRVDSTGAVTMTAEQAIYVTETQGDLVVASLSTDADAALTADNGGIVSLQSASDVPQGTISARSLQLQTSGSIGAADFGLQLEDVETVSVDSNVDGLHLSIEGSTDTTVGTSDASGVITSSEGITIASASGVTLEDDVRADGTIDLQADGLSVAGVTSTLDGADITLDAGQGELAVTKDVTVSDTGGDVTLNGSTVRIADNVTMRALGGRIYAEGDALAIGVDDTFRAKGIDWRTSGSLTANRTTFQTGQDGLSLTAQVDMNLKDVGIASDADVSLSAGNRLELDQDGTTDVSAAGTLTLSGDKGVVADRLKANAQGMRLSSDEGSVELTGQATLRATQELAVSGTQGVAAERLDAQAKNLQVTAAEGTVVLTDGAKLGASEGLAFSGTQGVTAERLDAQAKKLQAVSTEGSVDLSDAQLNVTDTLTVSARHNIDLARSKVPTSLNGALSYTAQEGDVDLSATQSSSDATQNGTGTLRADSITVTAGGHVSLADKRLDWRATGTGSDANSGDITLQSDKLALDDGSSLVASADPSATRGDLTIRTSDDMSTGQNVQLSAAKGHLGLDVGGKLTLGDATTLAAATVSALSQELELGDDNSISTTKGDLSIGVKNDAMMGGRLRVSATDGGAPARIEISAGGVLSVVDDAFTVEAQSGSVTVSGARGLIVKNDLTIVSDQDARLETESGAITIGNGAEIKAGTESGLAAGLYGRIDIDSGERLSIGEDAVILADSLTVQAQGDVAFGNNATLHGATDGVTVLSHAGDISMGESLEVVSNADKTRFTAEKGDVRVDRAATLTSLNSSVQFEAGRDVVFADDLTIQGRGFVVSGGRDIAIGEDAALKTHYTVDKSEPTGTPGAFNDSWQTTMMAGRDVTIGSNASFDTTMLGIVAGSADQSGSVRLGEDSRVETGRFGIAVVAWGDIELGRRAQFGTLDSAGGGAIALLARDGIRVDQDAIVKSKGNISMLAMNGDVVVGEYAALLELNATRAGRIDISSEEGNVSIDRNAQLLGAWIELAAQGGDLTIADGALLLADASGQVDLEAENNVLLDGRISVLAPDVMLTAHEGDIRFGEGTTLAGYGTQSVERMRLQAGRDIDMRQTGVLVATTDIDILADRHVVLGSDTRVYSDKSVTLTAQSGDIVLGGATRIGSSNADMTRFTDRVDLKAGGDIRQETLDVNRGIATHALSATAGGSVTLGAVNHSQTRYVLRRVFLAKGGNIAKTVNVDAGQDVVLALTSPIDATLTVNAARGGTVAGDLIVHGQGNGVTFANDLTVAGDVSVHAATLRFGRIEGTGLVEMSTDQYDTDASHGLYGKSIAAGRIVLLTGQGSIDIESLRSIDDLISVARSAVDVEGTIAIDAADSARTLNVYNARGAISTQGMHAADVLALYTGDDGTKADPSVLHSDCGVVMRVDGAASMARYLTTDYLVERDASRIVPGFVPTVSIDQQTLDDAESVIDDNDADALWSYVGLDRLLGSSGAEIRDYWTPWLTLRHNVVYFSFDSDVLTDEGRAALDRLVDTAYEYGIRLDLVNVGGYTDRLGGNAYNLGLADRRARAVKRHLVDKGVSSERIETVAHGKIRAIVDCARADGLKACLAPNRRTTIEIDATTPRSDAKPAYEI